MDEFNPIPETLFNSDTNTPFDTCVSCSTELLVEGQSYFIERIFRRVQNLGICEVLFEYAICSSCAEEMRGNISSESKSNIEQYMRSKAQKLRFGARSLDHCLITGKAIAECSEFTYHAHCKGDKVYSDYFPYAISDLAQDEIGALLSAETLDELDDFKGKHFSGPPEFQELINPRRLLPL